MLQLFENEYDQTLDNGRVIFRFGHPLHHCIIGILKGHSFVILGQKYKNCGSFSPQKPFSNY